MSNFYGTLSQSRTIGLLDGKAVKRSEGTVAIDGLNSNQNARLLIE
jgi:hypothetical protein